MKEKRENSSEKTSVRLHALDFLRGFYIILAAGQHYAALLAFSGIQMEGLLLWLFWILTPSGDQIFLALAAFNLAKRTRADFKSVCWDKVLIFAAIFCLFVFETFVAALQPEQALTWGPMHTWMTVLILLSILYRFLGVQGIVGLFVLQLLYWFLPEPTLVSSFKTYAANHIFLSLIIYNTPLELFIGSGCVGFLLGHYYYHGTKPAQFRQPLIFALGAAAFIPFLVFGTFWTIHFPNVWEEEYFVASQLTGIVHIWGTIILLITGGLLIEDHIRPLRMPIVNWIGRHSLIIFAFHMVFFVRVVMPLHFYFGPQIGFPPINTFPMMCLYVFPMIFVCYLILRSRLLLLMQNQGELS